MIYPDVTVEEWCRRYDLSVEKDRCPKCRKAIYTSRPFIEKGFVGLIAPKCSCGYDSGFSVQEVRPNFLESLLAFGADGTYRRGDGCDACGRQGKLGVRGNVIPNIHEKRGMATSREPSGSRKTIECLECVEPHSRGSEEAKALLLVVPE